MAKYIPLITSDQYHIVMMKTTVADPADGDWDNQDNAILVAGSGGNYQPSSPIISFWAYEDSSDIHIATQQQNGRVAYHVFDPGADAWTIRDEEIAVVGDTNFDEVPTHPGVSLALRSDGDILIFYTYHETTNDLDGILYAREEGAGWTKDIIFVAAGVSRPFQNPNAIGPDTSDRITIHGTSEILGTDRTWIHSIDSGNTISSLAVTDTTVDTAIFITGPGVINNADKIYVPYIDADNKISVADWTSGPSPNATLNIVTGISDNDVFGNGRTTAPFAPFCLALDGATDVHLLYSGGGSAGVDQDLYHDNDVDGGGAVDNEELDAVTVNRISCKKGTTDLLYVYDDGGTVKYDEISIVAFDPDVDAFRFYDDGTESGSSPKADQDTDIELDATSDAQFHVRYRVQNLGSGDGETTDDYALEVSKNLGSFAAVTASSSDVQSDTASGLTADGATTNRGTNGITDGTGSFVAGEQEETNGVIEDRQLTASNFTEHVWACKLIDADLGAGDTLDFRIALNGGAPGITNSVLPRITTPTFGPPVGTLALLGVGV